MKTTHMIRVYDESGPNVKRIGSTAFFRNRPLLRTLLESLDSNRAEVHVLFHAVSIGCELYSFMIAYDLYFRGRPAPKLTCYATDLSEAFLAAAKRGEYDEAILEDLAPEERAYFEIISPGQIRIRAESFERVNFLPASSYVEFESSRSFDVVFILNTLLYVPAEAQARTVERIAVYNSDLLVSTGYHADTIGADLSRHGYQPLSANCREIYENWSCRNQGPRGFMIPGVTFYTPTLPPYDEVSADPFASCALFRKAATKPAKPPTAGNITADKSSRYTLSVMLAAQRWPKSRDLKALDVFAEGGYGADLLSRKLGAHVIAILTDSCPVPTSRQPVDRPGVQYSRPTFLESMEPRSIDLVACFGALEQEANPASLIATLTKVLKPDGLLFLSATNESALPLTGNESRFPRHKTHLHESQLSALLEGEGHFKRVARFGQNVWLMNAAQRIVNLDTSASLLPQANPTNPQIFFDVYQRTATPATPATKTPADLTWAAEGAVIRDGGKGIEHPIGLSPRAEIYENATVGRYTYLNHGSVVYPNTRVGRFCSIGREVHLGPHNHPTSFLSSHPFQFDPVHFSTDPVYAGVQHVAYDPSQVTTTIGHDVWIGTHAIVLQGVTIGHGAIVGAGAIVTKDVPAYAIVVGNPAKVLRYRFDAETITGLLASAWWDRDLATIQNLPFNDISACLDALRST